MRPKIRKAVFPVAGLGTRFLPATKANPKEMLPIVDRPLIQYAAEEAVKAGIELLVFVTGRNKRAIPDHFDKAYELEVELAERAKSDMLDVVRNILPSNVACTYIRQAEALGLGHAVLCARPVVGEQPFAVILADDLIAGESTLTEMVEVYNEYGCSVLGVEEVAADRTHEYGVIKAESISANLWNVNGLVEKPAPGTAPSNVAIVGRYILTPAIFDLLEKTGEGAGGEIQLTDAIEGLLAKERVIAYRFEGHRYDCGSKLGYLKASVEYGLRHPELRDQFGAYLSRVRG
jgi:UTP--glucose-1-phosphate uridylyltransferase